MLALGIWSFPAPIHKRQTEFNMLVFLNDQFVPEAQATISVFDRSFLYGDGLFETMRVFQGRPFCWAEHMERLERGARPF